jgi:hypothetical protein
MRAAFTHPLGLTLLALSAALAAAVSHLPGLDALDLPTGWILFWGVVGYVATTIALLCTPGSQAGPAAGQSYDGATYVRPDLSAETISRQLRVEAIRHPATLFCLAMAAIAFAYIVLIARSTDGAVLPALLVVSALAGAGASYIWNYVFGYSERYVTRLQALMTSLERQQTRQDAEELRKLRDALKEGFAWLNSKVGVRALRGLEDAFAQLQPFLRQRRQSDPLSLLQVPVLAEETFRRGLSLLGDALELMRAGEGTDNARLKQEVSDLEREIQASEQDGSQQLRNDLRKQRLAMHRQRLEGLEQIQIDVDQLLYQADRCETSLYRSRIDLAAIRAGTTGQSVDSVIDVLRRTVEQARATQDELRRMTE